jgi:magnesium transporter
MSVESIVYAKGRGSASASFADARLSSRETGSLAWISLLEPDDEDFGVVADGLGVEPHLLVEAARFPHRSDVEKHENRLFAVLPVLRSTGEDDGTTGRAYSVQCDWVLAFAVEGPNMVVTLTDGDRSVLEKLRRGTEENLDLASQDSRAVLFEMVSGVVGDYERAVGAIEGRISDAEVAVMEGKSGDILRRVHALTSEAVALQQAFRPLASAMEQLREDEVPVAYRRLVRIRHRALRVTEKLDGARELLSSLLQVNLTVVGQKISAWGAILIVPSLIAGVFGMNFKSAWWIKADHGFEVMVAVMVLVALSLYLWFKRSGWL